MERHDLDPISLFFGIAFLGLASTGLFENVDFAPIQARWIWPALLIIAGGLVLLSSIRHQSQPEATEELPAVYGAETEDRSG